MVDCVVSGDKSESQIIGDFGLLGSPSRLKNHVGVIGDSVKDSILAGSSDFPTLAEAHKGVEVGNGGNCSGKVSAWNLLDQSLSFFPPSEKDGKILVQPPQDVLLDGAKQWSNALIGIFFGKSPTLGVFQRTANCLWGREGSVEIRFLAPSVYMKAIVLRRWSPGLVPEVLSLDSAPVWVRLWHVPLELYSQQGLGYLASALGKPLYTWCNHREEAPLSRKLDRCLVNQAWLDAFVDATVEFLPPNCSDHCPCFLRMRATSYKPPRPFKFFNFWVEHDDFLKIVEDSWTTPIVGNPLQILFGKLKRLKIPLRQFNVEHFGKISSRVSTKQLELAAVQSLMLNNPTAALIEQERIVAKELEDLSKAEEQFFRQKSRIQFIKGGDQITAYFFRQLKVRQKTNTVQVLQDMQGNRFESFGSISNELVQFFSDSLGSVDENVEVFSDDLLREILGIEFSIEFQNSLVAPITHQEIKKVLFSMNGNKAPGPDGYSAKFFQAAWGIVGGDFLRAVQYFFISCSLPYAFNSTIITLVPKVANPMKAVDFRPISCCCTVYKCITKILANRLKQGLPSIILPNQSAFLAGRDLVENVLLAQEIVNGYGPGDPKHQT
ncbi:hypothetical protein GQ457_10G028210 [Hibiscus cannabinus]